MKRIDVAAAIIVKDNHILATQRDSGEFKDGWEFPGGKLEPGETSLEACKRELMEELGVELRNERFLINIKHHYSEFELNMDCFVCELASDVLTLNVHEDARWLSYENLDSVGWLPADLKIIEAIRSHKVLTPEE